MLATRTGLAIRIEAEETTHIREILATIMVGPGFKFLNS